MEGIIESLGSFLPLVVNVGKALLILVVGWSLAGMISGMVRRRIQKNENIDKTLGNFVASIIKWVILLMVLAAVLAVFGIQTTSIVAMLSAATLAIGLALQGTLSDLASGFMLILFRPYKIDQYVDIGGTAGTVVDINLFVTELVTVDNVQIIIPNGQAWGATISNYSHHATRRLDLTFGIDYGDDAEKAMQIILDVAGKDARVLTGPEPWVRVTNLGDSSVDLTARLWCDGADYWELKFEMTKAVKEAFDKGGVTIPYPHSVEIQKAG
ncbi:mechanosensitive ion channel family protein [Roseovarius sp. EL26]|uniref:mechanosensitive ion channel family protein n=1 Tax=Roseovarius sp. EL26 TaxID=2126672 RepID=UPI000EA0F0A4|nr:mechanosensitive ion channel domain-containing protein [Roseovarius sp. EL26]